MRPGYCFRLCTEAAFHALPDSSVPEMQRCELASTVLQLKALGIDNIMKFDWLAPPPAETMIRALELLHALGALGNDARYAASCMIPQTLFVQYVAWYENLGTDSGIAYRWMCCMHALHWVATMHGSFSMPCKQHRGLRRRIT